MAYWEVDKKRHYTALLDRKTGEEWYRLYYRNRKTGRPTGRPARHQEKLVNYFMMHSKIEQGLSQEMAAVEVAIECCEKPTTRNIDQIRNDYKAIKRDADPRIFDQN